MATSNRSKILIGIVGLFILLLLVLYTLFGFTSFQRSVGEPLLQATTTTPPKSEVTPCCAKRVTMCCCQEENKTLPIQEDPDDPCKLRTKPTKEQLKMARIAWKYIENNFNEQTGLINAADNYPSASVWDWSNGVYAIYTAKKFGIITQDRFEEMMNAFLETMQEMEIFNNELPNKTYNTKTAKMTDYGNNEKPSGIGWSINDIARLLASLNLIQQCEASLNPTIEKLLLRYRYCRSISVEGTMYGATYEQGQTKINQETLTGYEEYAARSYENWGFDLQEARSYKFMKEVDIYGVKVPTETRKFYSAFLGSESFWYTGFDYGVDDNESGKYIKRIYEVQEARYKATSQLTAVTEDHIDEAPYFLYNTIYEDSEPWKIINHHAQDYSEFKSVSTKAAIGMRILFDTNYTKKLFDYIDNNYNKDRGYYAGIYETKAGKNRALTLNTNAIILESLLFKNMGPLQKINQIKKRGTYDYYRNHVNNFRCLPQETKPTILEPYNPMMNLQRLTDADREAAKIAWRFFENNYHPETGIVNAYENYDRVSMRAVGKTLMGTIAARSLDIITDEQFHTRMSRLLRTLKELPLYHQELPNKYYSASQAKPIDEEGWSIYDIAHFLSGLYHLQSYYPRYKEEVLAILSSMKFDRAITGGMFNAQIDNGTDEKLYQIADPLQEYYVHAALKLINKESYSHLVDERHLAYQRIYDYEVPSGHWYKKTNAESFLWTMLELPYYLKYKHFSSNIYLAQKQRYEITGKITTSSEEHLSQEPYFVSNDIYNNNSHWGDYDEKNRPLLDFSTYSTKVAFIYDALYGYTDSYAKVLQESVASFNSPRVGWYGGYYKDFDRVNTSVSIYTNAAVLESIFFKKVGNFYYHLSPKSQEKIRLHQPIHDSNRYFVVSPPIKLFAYAKMLVKRFEDQPLVRIERRGENYVVAVGSFDTKTQARYLLTQLDTTLHPKTFNRTFLNDTNDTTFRVEQGSIDSADFLWANRYYEYDYRLPYTNRIIEDKQLRLPVTYDPTQVKKKTLHAPEVMVTPPTPH